MAKTQMQYANRAWRTETKALGWHRGWKGGKREWKRFCRENAKTTVRAREVNGDDPFTCQTDANYAVAEELTYWEP